MEFFAYNGVELEFEEDSLKEVAAKQWVGAPAPEGSEPFLKM